MFHAVPLHLYIDPSEAAVPFVEENFSDRRPEGIFHQFAAGDWARGKDGKLLYASASCAFEVEVTLNADSVDNARASIRTCRAGIDDDPGIMARNGTLTLDTLELVARAEAPGGTLFWPFLSAAKDKCWMSMCQGSGRAELTWCAIDSVVAAMSRRERLVTVRATLARTGIPFRAILPGFEELLDSYRAIKPRRLQA